VLVIKSADSLE